jgi:hypothetical protein
MQSGDRALDLRNYEHYKHYERRDAAANGEAASDLASLSG